MSLRLVIIALFFAAPIFAGEESKVDYRLTLGGSVFDPLSEDAGLPDTWLDASREEPSLRLIQFTGPIDRAWTEEMDHHEIKVIRYIHPFTYIVWSSENRLSAYAAADHVRWTGRFETGYRVLPSWRNLQNAPHEIRVLVYRGADLAKIKQGIQLQANSAIQRAVIDKDFEIWQFMAAGSQYDEIASLNGIYSLQPVPTDGGNRGEMSAQLSANQVVGGAVQPGYQAWLTTIGLSGDGVIAAIVDDGTDDDHVDLVNNIIPCTGPTCGGTRELTHGTHTAGILAGDGSSGVTSQGFLRGLGYAPGASLVEQYYPDFYLTPGGNLTLMTDSFRNGATLSSNSWGNSGQALGYEMDTMLVDIGVRDADPDVPGDQPLSFVGAIDNGGGLTSTQGVPDEAKNSFKVGSTWLRDNTGAPINAQNSISNNSAHGPTLDGRNLPDIVAPGKWVDSCNVGDTHVFLAGTSMATPGVAGATVLFTERYRNLPENPGMLDPSPAMTKAAFLPVARDLEGNTDANGNPLGHRFDSKQGWGRMDIEAVLDPDVEVTYIDAPTVFTATSQTWTQDLFVADTSKPARVMLVWTDAPGHGLGGATPAWNNNLDLEVTYNSDTYLGNNIGADGWSETGGAADGMNNTEGVLIGPTAPQLDLTVTVRAANLTSAAVSGFEGGPSQDFALVCYNLVGSPDFNMVASQPEANICVPDAAVYQVNLGQIAGFSGTVNLSAIDAPAGTTVDFSPASGVPPFSSTVTVNNTAGLTTNSYGFQVQGTDGSLTHLVNLTLNAFDAAPAMPSLIAPVNGAVEQSTSPLFRWLPQADAISYNLQMATDAGFTDLVIDEISLIGEYEYTGVLPYDTEYFWRVKAINSCDEGAFSSAWSFTTLGAPPILLVDDDNDNPDARAAYTDALDFWGIGYDIWDTQNSLSEPDAADMAPYSTVLWFSTDAFDIAFPLAGPNAATEGELATYIDGGGCFILTSQHYIQQLAGNPPAFTSFMTNYLGIGSATLNTGMGLVQGSSTGFDHLGPFTVSPPYVNRADTVSPQPPAQLLFSGDLGDAGIRNTVGDSETFFLAFAFDGLENQARLQTILALAEACGVSAGVCRNEDNLRSKLPFWPDEENLFNLIDCVNTIFLVP